jgi:LSD1 subclass zinc finger protein
MQGQKSERVIHSYDTVRHRVLCGLPEQSNSTKHAAGVTCVTCRELLSHTPAAARSVRAAERGE